MKVKSENENSQEGRVFLVIKTPYQCPSLLSLVLLFNFCGLKKKIPMEEKGDLKLLGFAKRLLQTLCNSLWLGSLRQAEILRTHNYQARGTACPVHSEFTLRDDADNVWGAGWPHHVNEIHILAHREKQGSQGLGKCCFVLKASLSPCPQYVPVPVSPHFPVCMWTWVQKRAERLLLIE